MPFVQLLTHSYQIMRQYAGERRLKQRKNFGIETKMHSHNSRNIGHKNERECRTNVEKIGRDSPSVGSVQRESGTIQWDFRSHRWHCVLVAVLLPSQLTMCTKLFQLTGFGLGMRAERQQTRVSADAYIECENRMREEKKNAAQKRKIR